MNAELIVFNVNHGQAVGLRLPNDRWCIFDLGNTADFSPIVWMAAQAQPTPFMKALLGNSFQPEPFKLFKTTVSHFHGDHMADFPNLLAFSPEYLRTVDHDGAYLRDAMSSNAEQSHRNIFHFAQYERSNYTRTAIADYGHVSIKELSIPVAIARKIPGNASSNINNASVISRIDCYGNTILICGDIEKEAIDFALASNILGQLWIPLVSNVDVLVAPHHGHRSGYSENLMKLANPAVVLVSVSSKDESVDSRYSGPSVRGITIGQNTHKRITTREWGHINLTIEPPVQIGLKGQRSWGRIAA